VGFLDKLNAAVGRFTLSWASNTVRNYKKSALVRHQVVEMFLMPDRAMESILNWHLFGSFSVLPFN
jgi:hypothetical protein